MATTISNMLQSKVINALDTYQYTLATTAPHLAKIQLTEVPPSSISIVIKQNSTTLATSTAPAATQNHIELAVPFMGTSGDVIQFVITSTDDAKLNTIKGILQVTVGPQLN